MSHENPSRKRSGIVRLALASALALGALAALPASAQVPARFYWKTLSGANAVPLIFNSISGNTNPFDPAHLPVPGANVEGTLALAGYAHTFTLFDRAAMVAVLLPMGRLSGEVTEAGRTVGAVGPRVRRPDPRAERQPGRSEGAEEPRGRRCVTSRASPSISSPTSPCRSASTTTSQAAEPRPEPLVRAARLPRRLAARPLGAGPAHDAGAPPGRLALRAERRLRRAGRSRPTPSSRSTRTCHVTSPSTSGARSTASGTRAGRRRSTGSRVRS